MSDGDPLDRAGRDGCTEELQPRAPSILFQVAGRRQGGFSSDQRQAEPFGQGGNESGVGAGFVAAQSMVEVKDGQSRE